MWVSNQHVIYWHHIFVVLYATLLGTLLYFAKYCKIDLLIICLEIPKFYDSSCPEVREQTWIQFHPHTHFMSLTQVKVSVCNWYSVMWQLIQVLVKTQTCQLWITELYLLNEQDAQHDTNQKHTGNRTVFM